MRLGRFIAGTLARPVPACAVMLLGAMLAPALHAQSQQYPFQDPKLPVEDRITDLLHRMTLEEKIAALSTNPSVPRLGFKGAGHIEGLHGVALGGPGGWGGYDPVPQASPLKL